ncbi:MAG TPA: alpha/beta fold hydrolase [Acidimicrobiales bacterium]|nr:alpha/beta fold hydrolase [Acidimicrobiales bacterium]
MTTIPTFDSPAFDSAPVLPGAEAWSHQGGEDGVLVCHGFTGNPTSMRPLAEAFAAAGFTVVLPRWPGHGTVIEDMQKTTWADWSSAAEAAYTELASRCRRVVVAGLSMGGTLTVWLAGRHPEIAGIVVVNPAVEPAADSFLDMLRASLDQGIDTVPGIGSDVAKPDVVESAYPGTPVAPLISLIEGQQEIAAGIPDIRCPVLLMNSRNDHVVPPSNSDYLAEKVSGPVERVTFERSFHVATIDYDQPEIEARAVDFARKVTAG